MDNIAKSLAEYSPTVNDYATKINTALLPVASIIILTFFLVDVLSWKLCDCFYSGLLHR